MNRPDLVNVLIPLLVARLPDPFNPTPAQGEQCVDAAHRWADIIGTAEKARQPTYDLKDAV